MPQGDYFIDHERGIRWIIIPKCASTTLDVVLGIGEDGKHRCGREEALEHADLFTVVFIRHPWQRLVSAMEMPFQTAGPNILARLQRVIVDDRSDDVHVRPMHTFTDGFRLDFVGRLENMGADWRVLHHAHRALELPGLPDLVIENAKGAPPWRSLDYDFGWLRPRYAKDFELWEAGR